VDESTPMRGDVGSYSVAKVEAERIATRCPQATRLRPGIVYGPGGPQWCTRIAAWLFERRVGDLGAAGDGYCNLIHVDDVAKAALLALRNPAAAGEAFNLSLDDPPTWNEYFQQFAGALGAVPTVRISRRRLAIETKLVAPPLKVLEILLGRLHLGRSWLPEPIPPSILSLWRQEIRLSMSKTTRTLGLVCKPLPEGIRETAEAFNRSRAARGHAPANDASRSPTR
jgi:2-alkyl-3-oxoalkanoate reductase